MEKLLPYKNGFKKIEGEPANLYEAIYKQIWNDIVFNHNVWVDRTREYMAIDAPTLYTYIDMSLGTYKPLLETTSFEEMKKFYKNRNENSKTSSSIPEETEE